MTSNSSTTGIHTLNEDVLLHIFELNGNMFKVYGALKTTTCLHHKCVSNGAT